MTKNKIKFIDLFSGMGGIRLGFEQAIKEMDYQSECLLTSEIKPHAIKVHAKNFPQNNNWGDITQIDASQIPNFDFLLAGFPCQAFSAAGKRHGFMDTRGTLFFEIERILQEKNPYGFILENVEGLVNHDKVDKKSKIGRTLETILHSLESLGYKTSWSVLNSANFGLPQERKRVYIVGTKDEKPIINNFAHQSAKLQDVLQSGQETLKSRFTDLLLSHYSIEELHGKSIKDKRGGKNNIHSWDIELKGSISFNQKKLLNELFKQRRKKRWALEFGIEWMDGMPLTLQQISTFCQNHNLEKDLEDLVEKGYLKKEHPKKVSYERNIQGEERRVRVQDTSLPIGYNIVAGKLSFEVSKILDPNDICPTLVAMDMQKLFVPDNGGLRSLTLREGLRLCGYPENYSFDINSKEGYDLLGNTVTVPVIKAVAQRVLSVWKKNIITKNNTQFKKITSKQVS